MKIMKCKKCGFTAFGITTIPCCSECRENGAWDGESDCWTHDEKVIQEKNLGREQVAEEGQCNMGTAYGAGCHLFRCDNCQSLQDHLPMSDSC